MNTKAGSGKPLAKTVAVARAADAVGLSPSAAVAASLVSVTTPDMGIEQQPDPSLPSDIAPDYRNASSWAVEFSDVSVPAGNTAAMSTSKFVVFVDAYTGAFFFGTSVG